MRLAELAQVLGSNPGLRSHLQGLGGKVAWTDCTAEARPCLLAAAHTAKPRKTLIVTGNYEKALQWQARLALYGVPPEQITLLPSGLSALFEDAAPETVALSDRLGSLLRLATQENPIVIATPEAALERTLHPLDLEDHFVSVRQNDVTDAYQIAERLEQLGYEPAEPVRVPGQYSRRGGILDVFPMGADLPVRIEFYDDIAESLRVFDPMTQRSVKKIESLELALGRETLLPHPESGIDDMIEQALHTELESLDEKAAAKLEQTVQADLKALRARIFFDRLDLYRPVIQADGPCAADYLQDTDLLVIDEPLEIDAVANRTIEELAEALRHRHERGEILSSVANDFLCDPATLDRPAQILAFTSMNAMPSWLEATEEKVEAAPLHAYKGRPQDLTKTIKNWLAAGFTVLFSTDQPERTKAVLAQVEVFPQKPGPGQHDLPEGPWLVEGNPAGGYVLPGARTAVVTDQEIFGVARLRLPQRKFSDGVPLVTVLDLKPGDFVVHINFGIGTYRGLVKRNVDGILKEFLHIDYKAPDRLFVPADQLDRIQKYVAPGDETPKIHRLTGSDWKKTVAKAREDAREFARDLIALYAERKRVTRDSYGPDTGFMSEMEATFPWVETPSQLQAIEDVKTDLQTDYPMDRLVCGDVGFGKTEVAIRAAFKVAEAGKQVAVLCPTTILSEQHYRNFAERLAGFPHKLGLLNRFVHTAERNQTLKGLAEGSVAIVVGTHALLSQELKFNDLGLLVIDEEQKFGVKHKETLKNLRKNVDVLSMSATPIPRTLSMSLMDIRQMSLINDPPPGRLPIRTFVRPFSNEVLREAALRELARGGQVFYVSNRVQGINHVAEKIRKMLPMAKVAVGHGQMSEAELEPVMVGFIKGEIDVLVSTTIVESGLDIPNANTLIVENADRFGLGQLYQLRGRVGRSDRQAYAYFLYSNDQYLSENASERLGALAEFSQLGSGYSLAFRDLQIRGAGDLLGAKQSGQMASVGYDLYSQLIESEVQFLKTVADGGERPAYDDPLTGLEPLPVFDLPVHALIPQEFIDDQGQRLFYYKALMSARNTDQLNDVVKEMEDRYGHLPNEVRTAADVMSVRIKARAHHVESVDGNGGRLALKFLQSYQPHPRLPGIIQARHREFYVAQEKLIWPFTGNPVQASHDLIDAIASAEQEIDNDRVYVKN